MLDIGRVCLKTTGREAGKFCVIVERIDDEFMLVTGPRVVTGVKRRRCNRQHLEPTPEDIKLKKGATDDDVLKAYKDHDLFKKLGVKPPTKEQITKAKEAELKRLAQRKAEPKKKEAKAEPKKEGEKATPEKEEKKKPEKEKPKAAPKKKAAPKPKPAAKKAPAKKK